MSDITSSVGHEHDAEDAARWREIKKYLKLDVEEREHWETVSRSSSRRTEERRLEWYWNITFNDEYWKLGATVTEHGKVPSSIEEAIDAVSRSNAANGSQEK